MPRPQTWPPKLTRKSGTTEARCYYRGRWHTCGRWDTTANAPTPEAKHRWAELVDLWTRDPNADPAQQYTLAEVLVEWLQSPDSPVHRSDRSWIPVVVDLLVEHTDPQADQFDGPALEQFQTWLSCLDEGQRYNRTSVKKVVQFVRRCLQWAARNKIAGVTWDQYYELTTVPPPKPGRVRESRVVLPAREDQVIAAAACCGEQIGQIMRLLWWTGARPNELLSLRAGEVLRSGVLRIPKVAPVTLGPVWVAQVTSKVSRLGHVRCLVFGPRSQEILPPILSARSPREYLFRPQRGGSAARTLGERYIPAALTRAVREAARKAGCGHFSPYQIRHACSERVRAEMGEEAEQAYLGHGGRSITDRYAGWNSTLAVAVGLRLG